MAKLVYLYFASLDGYVEDERGKFDWTEPDEEVHAFINDLMRPIGTYLYGHRMYEVMAVWETDPSFAADSPAMSDFATLWQAADKIVYSTSLAAVSTTRTRIERAFNPDAVRQLKGSADHDIGVGGADLAAQALRAGLVDECHLFVAPVVVGSGKPLFPNDLFLTLDLLDVRHFDSGMVYLRYHIRT